MLLNYDQLKENLVMRVQNESAELADDLVKTKFEDLVITYYAKIDENERAYAGITHQLLKQLNVSEEQLKEDALSSSPKIMPATLNSLTTHICGLTGNSFTPGMGTEPEAWIVTNTEGVYGASAFMYPGVKEWMYAKIGRYFVLPSSVHEVLLMPDIGTSADDLKALVKDVNETQLEPGEWLSDNIYYYDGTRVKMV